MSADAELVLTADTRGLVKGSAALKNLANEAKRTEAATLAGARANEAHARAALSSAKASANATKEQISAAKAAVASAKAQTDAARAADIAARAFRHNDSATQQVGAAVSRFGNISREARGKIQNLGFQLQDVAVQAQMGTNAFTILGQQGSQILGIFGPMGSLLGAGLAIAAATGGVAMAGLGGNTKTAAEAARDFADSAERAKEAAKAARTPLGDLAKEYGTLAKEAKAAAIAQAQTAAAVALADMKASQSSLSGMFGGFSGPVEGLTGSEYEETLRRIRTELSLTGKDSVIVAQRLEALSNANGPKEVANSARDLREALISAGVNGADPLLTQVNDVWQAAINAANAADILSGNIAGAAKNAASLTSNLGGAMSALSSMGKDIAEQNKQIQIQIDAVKSGTDMRIASMRAEAKANFEALRNSPVGNAAEQYARATAEIDKYENGLKALKAAQEDAARSTNAAAAAGGRAMQSIAEKAKEASAETETAWQKASKSIVDNFFGSMDHGFDGLVGKALDAAKEVGAAWLKARIAGGANAAANATAAAASAGGGLLSGLGAAAGPIGIGLAVVGGLFGAARRRREERERKRQEQLREQQEQLRERNGLEIQLAIATGDVAKARKLQLENIKESNRALQSELWAAEDAARIKAERNQLEYKLAELRGDTEAMQQMELQNYDNSNHALVRQIWAMEEAADAAEKLASEAEKLASALSEEQFVSRLDFNRARAQVSFAVIEGGKTYSQSDAQVGGGQNVPSMERKTLEKISDNIASMLNAQRELVQMQKRA